ncbi:MAG: hypothetical protein ABI760_00305 [Ferruginibacter sp.]
MNKVVPAIIFITTLNAGLIKAQDSTGSCKVLVFNLGDSYKGECKNGLAHGQGEAIGRNRYNGSFKYGKPNGYGVYHYDDSSYHEGYFLDGQKEGKGETHYLHKGKPDSTIKGYWSGNEFRGKKYTTYAFDGASKFDRSEIIGTPETGNTISFEISTTSGSPTGVPSDFQGQPGYVLRLVDLNSASKSIIRLLSTVETPTRFHVTYDISEFPVTLYATMSNGDSFKLELYKPAKWTVRLFINR